MEMSGTFYWYFRLNCSEILRSNFLIIITWPDMRLLPLTIPAQVNVENKTFAKKTPDVHSSNVADLNSIPSAFTGSVPSSPSCHTNSISSHSKDL